MRHPLAFIIFLSVFILLTDLYTFRGISALSQNLAGRQRLVIGSAFWLVSILGFVWLIWFSISFKNFSYEESYRNIALFMGFFVLFYVPKLFFNVFQLVNDIAGLLAKGTALIFSSNESINSGAQKINRSEFLLQVGIIVAAIPFLSIIWGIWKGRYNFKVTNLHLDFPNLPQAFHGTKILQISDFHIGSFAGNPDMVEKAIELINQQKADYIVFTGDMVNNIASEVEGFIPMLQKLEAKHGKFSILGNHDYGEYYQWTSKEQLRIQTLAQ